MAAKDRGSSVDPQLPCRRLGDSDGEGLGHEDHRLVAGGVPMRVELPSTSPTVRADFLNRVRLAA